MSSLNVDIQRNGTITERVKTIQDANAQALAASQANKDAPNHEPQAISDTQLALADFLIQQAATVLAAKRQLDPLGHARNARREIGNALKTR